MKVTTLEPVHPLTPIEVSRRADVPLPWLLRMLDRGKIPYAKTSWLRFINSSELDAIRAHYQEYLDRHKK